MSSDSTAVLAVAAYVLAVVSAARSTWSPCGLSMLSSITPIGERGRGHRFGPTAVWYVVGAVAGGATLGAGMAVLALLVRAAGPGNEAVALLTAAAVVALAGAAADAGLLGFRLPVLRRQVNEVWLDRFRHWVYGAGFGWQIGVGFATYLMTASVVVIVVLAGLTARPGIAFGVGVVFGAARGLTVLLGAQATTPVRLQAAFRRWDRWRRPVWVAVLAAQVAASIGLASAAWWPLGIGVAVAVVATLAVAGPGRVAARAGMGAASCSGGAVARGAAAVVAGSSPSRPPSARPVPDAGSPPVP